ncbi:hypothetical protein [Legionella fairfieldensis]|uniref:hypothetical protein n=1 Tax=Legionella fairfieldensis TaxID=45064 RepID=UPI000491C416|nr:hypothetical protein [Legionella fairfieldensis]
MTIYRFQTNCLIQRGDLKPCITIEFEYFFPQCHNDWQDKERGSVRLLRIEHQATVLLLSDFSILEQISLRHACWDYLENNN